QTVPWPERVGPLLVAGGLILGLVPVLNRLTRGNNWRIPSAAGGLLWLSAGVSHAYRVWEASYHDLDFMAGPLAAFYRLLGLPAAADPPLVHLQVVGNLQTIDCTLEKLVGHPLPVIVVAGLVAIFLLNGRRAGWRLPLLLLLLAAVYAFFRSAALGLALEQMNEAGIYYRRIWVFGSLLPLILLLTWVVPPLRHERGADLAPAGRVSVAATGRGWTDPLLAVLLGVGLAGALGFYDPGDPKPGRVMIDENHSNWEWSTVALNTESYGVQTVYNYSELVRYLRHFYAVDQNFAVLGDSLLAAVDVLILKTPTKPYADAEVDAVVRFVERGGGLWLVGDHTNVFGMSTNLNRVGRHFGMTYNYDAVIDLLTYGRQYYRHPRLFAHPSLRHLPPLLLATSSSMVGPLLSQPVMIGRTLLSDQLDYSVNAFFGDFRPSAGESFGAMLQSVAVPRGRGRVLGFSDSTIFSNFFMFIRGKPELALGSVAWLMSTNRFGWVRHALLAMAGIGALLLLVRLPRQHGAAPFVLQMILATLFFALTARALDRWTAAWSTLPRPHTPLPTVAFDRGKTDYDIPDIREVADESPASFHTFYVWTQRTGWIPTTGLFEDCLAAARATVLIRPSGHYHATELAELEDHVRQGGGLLVLDSPHSRHSAAQSILQAFGMGFSPAEMESVTVSPAAGGLETTELHHVRGVTGGRPVLVASDGTAVLAYTDFGRGRVVAMCAADNFTDAVMGTTSAVPTPEQLALYRIEYLIFEELLDTAGAWPARDGEPPAGGGG
ncbi:GldG family protein, partial [bacterium]|nr:GldG family protein [bacterium]